ncbi:hypothetical protein [Sphingomonas colocasiae]|uniref:Uncharacterized protein n=1 Tax=Sphingomonas colocasiae TaxID=1848973 RepID=A0ABS7PY39_9SPHN|nr:hypothetical protein [Sphingomonas colocasiae]MBY8825570.1 hypothetical protein [Sphingomonas colocasiae]
MTSINRVDQAILLLQDRLKRLQERNGSKATDPGKAQRSDKSDALAPLRRMTRQGGISEEDLRRALVRTLLSNALGGEQVSSLEFNSIADQVLRILESNDAGRDLLQRALSDLE